MEIKVIKNIMQKYQDLAQVNRSLLDSYNIFSINIMSSPGAGKTTLLEETISLLSGDVKIAVIEGDLMTSRDAERIGKKGVPVVQINTQGGCHLDSSMIDSALKQFNLADLDIVIIENVGNLICPSTYDLGEHEKIVVISVPEGDDKPGKYPVMFQEADLCILNKVDLLPYSNFNVDNFLQDVKKLNPDLEIIKTSAVTGEGMDYWGQWLKNKIKK
ncbi:MAG: hydrogenase nickel incorporation protein HypB [Peptococcaceae bacterium]|nr:hydrogenase nickel incorporation protein HypB [Peptococcaceae bacterium]